MICCFLGNLPMPHDPKDFRFSSPIDHRVSEGRLLCTPHLIVCIDRPNLSLCKLVTSHCNIITYKFLTAFILTCMW